MIREGLSHGRPQNFSKDTPLSTPLNRTAITISYVPVPSMHSLKGLIIKLFNRVNLILKFRISLRIVQIVS